MWYGIPFKAEHLFSMKLQPSQQWIKSYLTIEGVRTLENEWAATLMEDGRPLASVGPIVYWSNRASIWSFIGSEIKGKKFLKLHLMTKKYLDGLPFRRLEIDVDVDFETGHRWASLLGFNKEAECMKSFQIDGRDCSLYSKVRN